jgi:phosphopantothenoylcysteine decarboxylase/phosphopantothenate--cysteine ligase
VNVIPTTSAAEMATAVLQAFEETDILIKSAAVADYRPTETAPHKIKKTEASSNLTLERTQDILMTVAALKTHQLMVGFAAETCDLETFARQKLTAKRLDMIVGNRIGAAGSGFEVDTNQVTLYFKNGDRESIEMMPKAELAHLILDRVIALTPTK